MEFDWNPTKCAKNVAERGIDFSDVVVAFADLTKKVARDDRKDYGEERFNMLAKVEGRVFHITFTKRQGDLDHLCAKGKQTGAAAL
jgi:uncharacterized DUF497 family protein